jgi:Zn-finger nucleic acid-binding protein
MERRTFGEGDLHMEVCINCQSVWMDGGMLMAAYEVMMREGVFSLHSAERENDPWR